MNMAIPPSKLYKYQSCANPHNLENLLNGVIWLSKPIAFNDPFDCNIPFQISEPGDEDWAIFADHLKKQTLSQKDIGLYFDANGKLTEYCKYQVIEGAKIAGESWVKVHKEAQAMGVACFSECVDDILMWGHYAAGHRGYCLEFDTTFPPFRKAHQVIYSALYPSLNPIEAMFARPLTTNPVLLLMATKSTHWSYEREWRILDDKGDYAYKFVPEALTGVYCGCAMTEDDKLKITETLADYPTVYLYQMRRFEKEFKVKSERIA
jgi:hypothetical protein